MEPCPSPFNLAEYVLQRAEALSEKTALAILGPTRAETWSYGELHQAVLGVATGLLEQGLAPGDRVMLRMGNGIAFPLAYLGAISVGIVPIPTSSQLTQAELDRLWPLVSPKAVVAGAGVALPSAQVLTVSEDALLAMTQKTPAVFDWGDPNRLSYIMFTSGTSGQPKAVAHAHRAIWARQMMYEGWYGLRADDRLLHAGALNWTFTLGTGLLDPWSVGATALIPADGTPLDALPDLLRAHGATLFAAAPGVLRKLLKTPDQLRLTTLRHTLTAGEHLQPDLRAAWEGATGKGLYDAFGMTECSTFLSASPTGAPSLTVQPGRQVGLSADGVIQICRSEPGLMLGYVEGEQLNLPLTDNHFLTSDRAVMRADGSYQYEGRIADLLNPGGYRVSPHEVEGVLLGCDGVEEIAVTELSIGSSTFLAACYTAAAPLVPSRLNGYAEENLARYKQPRLYRHVDALPRGTNGKLLRNALPSLFEDPS
ncbi:MAG: acyl--CoA ligase [Rhodobacteraceae bacterium]|nr:acyl--CoA ligase [Paracoccaceae bacterium]